MKKVFALTAVTAVLALGACSDDDSTADTTTTAAEQTTTTAAATEVTVENAWARTSPMSAEMGAAYFDITSPVDDALVKASADMSVAMMVQIHETTMNDDGTMGMQEVAEVALPAGETVSLKPGGYHVMLMNLKAPLETGSTVTLTLTLKSGATLTVDAEVRESTGM